MKTYKRYRFPPDIISYAVWLYYRFSLSHRDIEVKWFKDLLAERGVTVSHESIRLWCNKFGHTYTRRLKRKRQGYGDTFYIDEVFVKINGELHYLWRAGQGRRLRLAIVNLAIPIRNVVLAGDYRQLHHLLEPEIEKFLRVDGSFC